MKAILVIDIDEKHSNAIDELRADISINCYGEEIECLKNQCLKPLGLKTKTDGYVLYSTEYLKKNFETEYMLWKDLYGNE